MSRGWDADVGERNDFLATISIQPFIHRLDSWFCLIIRVFLCRLFSKHKWIYQTRASWQELTAEHATRMEYRYWRVDERWIPHHHQHATHLDINDCISYHYRWLTFPEPSWLQIFPLFRLLQESTFYSKTESSTDLLFLPKATSPLAWSFSLREQ